MSTSVTTRMDSDSFIAWAMEQPEGEHYELHDGEVVQMPNERALHNRVKMRIFRRFEEAIEAASLSVMPFGDGMAVEVDRGTVFEPDVQIVDGPPLSDDAVKITTPLIVVEVLSPSTRGSDQSTKLAGYFRIASLRHYLVVDPAKRRVIRHTRAPDGVVTTHVHGDEPILLDPPGIVLADVFPA